MAKPISSSLAPMQRSKPLHQDVFRNELCGAAMRIRHQGRAINVPNFGEIADATSRGDARREDAKGVNNVYTLGSHADRHQRGCIGYTSLADRPPRRHTSAGTNAPGHYLSVGDRTPISVVDAKRPKEASRRPRQSG